MPLSIVVDDALLVLDLDGQTERRQDSGVVKVYVVGEVTQQNYDLFCSHFADVGWIIGAKYTTCVSKHTLQEPNLSMVLSCLDIHWQKV